ncbi:unnamed protein product [Rotaria magnacalcarata]|uniref:Uncharacterized protein n=1 Tax=Rotaria magnacalcarata TaxID=392030 RepID=A0A816SX11_9BILA|nr:unnamed protein product [Rotaria magnacalcarata]CAF1637667.1 unnamed protein product [Rotaria magnacalcarata]CAF2089224.1 unnamed protein product [Rotaria magnacalcarata]CAF2090762.1 unnamed protein product [Rotaria magnacalcarata]CAF2146714.1 unnamed protein product [Rotaria magnacalcarata]
MLENSTRLISSIVSSSSSSLTNTLPTSSNSPPERTRIMINAIYIAGVAFMVGVFLLLLWVNLCSQTCWSWHDTPIINRFNRQWLIRRSMGTSNDSESSKDRQQRKSLNDDEPA